MMTIQAPRLLKNLMYLSGAEVASKIVTFAAIAYLARVAGPVGYGYVEFAGAVLLCAGLIVDQGFGPYGAREIAKTPERTAELVSEIVFARFILALFAYAFVVAFALLVVHSSAVTVLLFIYGISLLVTPLLLQWVFQGHAEMQTVGVLQVIRQVAFAAVIFLFVRTEAQIWVAAVAEIVGVSSAAAYGVWMYRRKIGEPIRARWVLSRQLFREGVPIGLSQLFWMMRMYGATVIVGLIASDQDVGFFGAAMRILIALHAFIFLYYFNLLPSLSQAWQRGDGTFAALIARSLHSVVWLSLAGGLGWALLALPATVAVYGAAFAPAGVALRLLSGVGVAAALSGHYRYGLVAAGLQNLEMLVSALGAVLVLILVPFGYSQAGVSGAAVGLVLTELVVWWAAWWAARKKLGLRRHSMFLIRPFLVGVFVLALLWLLPYASPLLQTIIALAAIGASALLLDGDVRNRFMGLVVKCRPWIRVQLDRMTQAVR
ncbi:MAG TPA: flippase [Anaerolineae bacterium]